MSAACPTLGSGAMTGVGSGAEWVRPNQPKASAKGSTGTIGAGPAALALSRAEAGVSRFGRRTPLGGAVDAHVGRKCEWPPPCGHIGIEPDGVGRLLRLVVVVEGRGLGRRRPLGAQIEIRGAREADVVGQAEGFEPWRNRPGVGVPIHGGVVSGAIPMGLMAWRLALPRGRHQPVRLERLGHGEVDVGRQLVQQGVVQHLPMRVFAIAVARMRVERCSGRCHRARLAAGLVRRGPATDDNLSGRP